MKDKLVFSLKYKRNDGLYFVFYVQEYEEKYLFKHGMSYMGTELAHTNDARLTILLKSEQAWIDFQKDVNNLFGEQCNIITKSLSSCLDMQFYGKLLPTKRITTMTNKIDFFKTLKTHFDFVGDIEENDTLMDCKRRNLETLEMFDAYHFNGAMIPTVHSRNVQIDFTEHIINRALIDEKLITAMADDCCYEICGLDGPMPEDIHCLLPEELVEILDEHRSNVLSKLLNNPGLASELTYVIENTKVPSNPIAIYGLNAWEVVNSGVIQHYTEAICLLMALNQNLWIPEKILDYLLRKIKVEVDPEMPIEDKRNLFYGVDVQRLSSVCTELLKVEDNDGR